MKAKRHWIPLVGSIAAVAIAAVIVTDLYAQKAPAGDYSKAATAEVRDAQGQVILRGQFALVDAGDEEDVERKAGLEPTGIDPDAAGEAEVEVSKEHAAEQEIELAIRNVQASAAFTFVIDGKEIATITADRRGRADVDLEVAPPSAR
jgi:hypothetical protein